MSAEPCAPEDKEAPDTEDRSYLRWLAYTGRIKVIASSVSLKVGSARYLAFTSDVGEAFRPTVPGWLVNASYGLSVAYIGGTIAEVGLKANWEGRPRTEIQALIAQEAVFQGLASLALPFLLIHTSVHRTAVVLKRRSVQLTHPAVARWAPSAVGLGCIPLLPSLVDKPVEHVVESFFDTYVHQNAGYSHDFFSKIHKGANKECGPGGLKREALETLKSE